MFKKRQDEKENLVEYKGTILKLLRRRLKIAAIFGFLMLLCLGSLTYITINQDYDSSILVDTLGRQRMLSQSIAKEASMLLINHQQYEKYLDNRQAEVLEGMQQAKENLLRDTLRFDETLSMIEDGTIEVNNSSVSFDNKSKELQDVLKETQILWKSMKTSALQLSTEKVFNEGSIKAVQSILESNQPLMINSNQITQSIVKDAKERKNFMVALLGVLVLMIFCIISLMILQIYRYLLLPLGKLYSGLYKTGLTRVSAHSNVPTVKELTPVVEEVQNTFSKFNQIMSLMENLNSKNSFQEMLQYIYSSFSFFIPYEYIGIALIDGGDKIRAAYGISGGAVDSLPSQLLDYKVAIRETSLEQILSTGKPRIINNLEQYVSNRPYRRYNEILLQAGVRASITLPLKLNERPVGVIFFSSTKKDVYTMDHIKMLQVLANSIAISLERNIFVNELLYSTISALAKLAESRDSDTGDHLSRMKNYARLITELLWRDSKYSSSINIEYIYDIERFSPLHDIGKVAIRDEILLKPGRLTKEEFEIMKTHAIFGAQVLSVAEENVKEDGRSLFTLGIEIAEGHHEKWDGSGYPYGRKGEEIPLSARIVALADVFDALTSKRPYKDAFSLNKAYEIIEQGCGSHFDPEIVQVFMNYRENIEMLYSSFQEK